MQCTVSRSGNTFEISCLSLIMAGSTMYVGEFAGSATGVKAAWASIVSHEEGNTGVSVNVGAVWKTVYVPKDVKFIRKPVSTHHYILLSQAIVGKNPSIMIGGDLETPSPYFKNILRAGLSEIAFMDEWIPLIWKLAIRDELVVPLAIYGNFGTTMWQLQEVVSSDWSAKQRSEKWHKLIKEVVTGKEEVDG